MNDHEMIEWFKSAPADNRYARMVWAAQKIAAIDKSTVIEAYVRLDRALAHREIKT